MVEAVRVGTIVARDRMAASKWAARKAQSGPGGKGLTGANLDKMVSLIDMRTRRAKYAGGRSGSNVKTERMN